MATDLSLMTWGKFKYATEALYTKIKNLLTGKANVQHTHSITDITDYTPASITVDSALSSTSENPVQNKIIKTALDGKAEATHTHQIVDISNLENTLNNKAASAHTHAMGDVNDLSDTLNLKAEKFHHHQIDEIDNLQETIDGKQNALTFDTTPTANSTNPVTSGGVQAAIEAAAASGTDVWEITEVEQVEEGSENVIRAKTLVKNGDTEHPYDVETFATEFIANMADYQKNNPILVQSLHQEFTEFLQDNKNVFRYSSYLHLLEYDGNSSYQIVFSGLYTHTEMSAMWRLVWLNPDTESSKYAMTYSILDLSAQFAQKNHIHSISNIDSLQYYISDFNTRINSLDAQVSQLDVDKQNKRDTTLTTTSKFVPDAINELNTNKASATDLATMQTTVGSIEATVGSMLDDKQDKADSSLSTTSKTVIGGINEVNENKIDTAGTGLIKSGTTLNHRNSVTARTTAVMGIITFDAQGHITGFTEKHLYRHQFVFYKDEYKMGWFDIYNDQSTMTLAQAKTYLTNKGYTSITNCYTVVGGNTGTVEVYGPKKNEDGTITTITLNMGNVLTGVFVRSNIINIKINYSGTGSRADNLWQVFSEQIY